MPTSLNQLDCNNNQLTALPTLPASLTLLYCYFNQLTALPPLPASLTLLYCQDNQLTALPQLPASLNQLDCNNNQLTALPQLPASLTKLYCWNNQLTALPSLPTSLTLLFCGNNQLTTLPILPDSLTSFQCYNNQLTALPALPDSLNILYCNDNPNLTCLPRLKKVKQFYFYNTSITCLPNYPQSNTNSNPPLNTLPFCDLYNTNSCDVYWNITGKAFYDSIADCTFNSGEQTYANLKLKLYSGGVLQQQVLTNNFGSYTFDVNNYGTYNYFLDTSNLPFTFVCPDSGYYISTITPVDSIFHNRDFGLRCKPGFDLGIQSVVNQSANFLPANYSTISIAAGDMSNYYGTHCIAGVSGTVQAVLSGPYSYISNAGTRAPSAVLGDTIT